MTVRFLADEHIARKLVVGLRRVVEDVDIVRLQDVGLRTLDDPAILEWAADHQRVLITHDIATMPDFAYQRVAAGHVMAGVIVIPATIPIGNIIDELAVIAVASDAAEWSGRVTYFPIR